MPSRNVENRDRGRREWVGGRFCPPLHVMEGGPYRPQITMWLELPEPLVVACHVEDPKEQTTFAQTLREAMRRPLAGPPRRPGRVRVADALQAAELRAAMPDLEVAVAPAPELGLLRRAPAEHLLQSTPEKDTESYLEGGRIPAPAVARLFEAARLLYVVAPWKTASDDQILRVDIPQLGIEGACLSIIGALGQNLGFILFPSLEGFEAFQQLCQKEPKAEGPLDLGTTILSLNFERGADLPPSMRREVAEHGWQVAGPRACPRIDHLERDGLRRPLTEHDLRVVSAVATSLGALFVKHGSLARAEADPICESWAGNDGLTVRFTAPYDAAHHFAENAPRPVAASPKVGRNQPCPCGSGKKYKKCCLPASEAHAATPSPAPVHERDQDLVAQMRRYAKRRFGEAWARAASDFADAAQSVQLFGPWSVYVFEVEGRPIVGWSGSILARFHPSRQPRYCAGPARGCAGKARFRWRSSAKSRSAASSSRAGKRRSRKWTRGPLPTTAAQHRWRRAALHHGPLLPRARCARRGGSTFTRARGGAASGGGRRGLLLVPAIGKRDAQGLGEHREREGLGLGGSLEVGVEFDRTGGRTAPPHRRGMHGPAPPPRSRALGSSGAGEHSPPSEPEDELPPEVQQRLVRDLKERHYADWPDQPLPAPGGKTPRDAARTRRRRAQTDLPPHHVEPRHTP